MFLYQVRPRIFRFETEEMPNLKWPLKASINFHFQPMQPFGMQAGGGRTAVQSVPATGLFNANSGVHTIESEAPLGPLKFRIEEGTRLTLLDGNILTTSNFYENLQSLHDEIESIYLGLPGLLNISIVDAPYVERVEGHIQGNKFRWELSNWNGKFDITTQELQEAEAAQAWQRMYLVPSNNRRLMASLHYFHVACRLAGSAASVGELLPEVLLNFAKVLEALFPSSGGVESMDAAREGLAKVGIGQNEIERDFIPSIVLRNNIGVSHATLSLFTREQLTIIHAYTERAESAFRKLMDTVVGKIESGHLELAPYESTRPKSSVIKIIEKMKVSNR